MNWDMLSQVKIHLEHDKTTFSTRAVRWWSRRKSKFMNPSFIQLSQVQHNLAANRPSIDKICMLAASEQKRITKIAHLKSSGLITALLQDNYCKGTVPVLAIENQGWGGKSIWGSLPFTYTQASLPPRRDWLHQIDEAHVRLSQLRWQCNVTLVRRKKLSRLQIAQSFQT